MKWGLVGASTIASQHMIAAFRVQEAGDVTWLVSGSKMRGETYAVEHNIAQCTTEIDCMLADPEVDAVYISSTNEKHYDQTMCAINAGKHVLCEKPLAMSLEQAVEMVNVATKRGVVLATNHHLRNAGAHLAIRDLVTSGVIGDVQSMRVLHAVSLPQNLQGWRINNISAGGGVILDIIVHDADTVRFHLGEDPTDVVAIAGSSGMSQGVEDSVMTAWTMPSGVMVQVHASFTHRFAETGLEIYGSKGAILGRGVMTQRPVGTLELVTSEGHRSIPFSPHSLYERTVALFVAASVNNTPPAADGTDGVKSLAVALAVREAAVQGQKIIVEYDGL